MMLVPALATALVYGVGGHLAIAGTLTVGTLLALATLLLRLLGPLQGLSNVRIDVMTALVSFERVFEVLDLPSMIAEKPDAVAAAGRRRAPGVRPRRLQLPARRGDLAGLPGVGGAHRSRATAGRCCTDISFVAEPGQMVALVGPVRAPARPRSPTWSPGSTTSASGAVRVGGHDVRDVTLQSLEDTVGYVTQDAHMFHDTIRANLLYARPGATDDRDLGRARGGPDRRAWSAALPDGLDTVVGDRGYRLSGGERQRLAIARLLLKAPAIVVLDEATAHLDSESEAAVQRALDAALDGPHVAGHRPPALDRARTPT